MIYGEAESILTDPKREENAHTGRESSTKEWEEKQSISHTLLEERKRVESFFFFSGCLACLCEALKWGLRK